MSLDLIQSIRAQSKLSISHAISLIENQKDSGIKLLSDLYKYTGKAYRLGITGPPGAGKSSIVDNLIQLYRKQEKKVAVIAVDPTSPFSGGAILGDRIRMSSHSSDPNVFIRSMATRGGLGGLAMQTEEVGEILDAAQFDVIIFETVGVGQVELDVMQAVDSVIVLLVPESGDEVQLLKAGIMEIGDIFVVNKSDRPGANTLLSNLNSLISNIKLESNDWRPDVVQTIATERKGVDDLLKSIYSHQLHNNSIDIRMQKTINRYRRLVNTIINSKLEKKFWDKTKILEFNSECKKKRKDRLSPYLLAKKLIDR